MKKILGNDIYIRGDVIRNDNGKIIYIEKSDGDWVKREYDDKGNLIYHEDSDGYWRKMEYDYNGKRIYWEDSNGYIRHYR